jgi:spore coat polysaccharide biosynthesis predicted glycosyltransferase SpsG
MISEDDYLALDKIKSENLSYDTFKDEDEFLHKIKKEMPDIVINDVLDTDAEYMNSLNEMGIFTVNFEDLGSGADQADVVVNALYEISNPPANHLYGYRYVVLRDEFHLYPSSPLQNTVRNILITFGGIDPNNLTLRTLRALDEMKLDTSIRIITGYGYQPVSELEATVEQMKKRGGSVELFKDVKVMAKHMYESDIIITSNGRTIYEVSAMHVPCISISQNERETSHLFSHLCRGIMNLGIADRVTEADIANSVERILDFETRARMVEAMKKYDIRSRTQRVVDIIFERYKEWEYGRKGAP